MPCTPGTWPESWQGRRAGERGGGGERRKCPVQGDPYRLRKEVQEGRDGAITFPGLVECAWNGGIAVGHLPPLAFHAAYFDMDGRGG